MKEYKDILGRCACMADAATGIVEHKYKRVSTRTRIPIGGTYTIEREDVITILKRIDMVEFQVTSNKKNS